MMITIDKFFVEELNKKYNLDIKYKEFVAFYKETREKKKTLGLVMYPHKQDLIIKEP